MEKVKPSCYLEIGRRNQKLIIEWSKLSALSKEFSDIMASLASLGIESFRGVEVEFLQLNQEAAKEDPSLQMLAGLTGNELEAAIDRKLHHIFFKKGDVKELSPEMKALMENAYYYIVTIREESSDSPQGIITFLSGGPVPEDEFKITMLAVDKSVRSEGFSQILINSFEKIGVNPKKILVSTRPTNSIAINAYKKAGFIEDTEGEKRASSYLIKGHWIHLMRGPAKTLA